MAMLPEEKQMVAKYKNKPFVLVGIDSDGEQAALQKLMSQNKVTWRMIVDHSTDGPIAKRWNIHGWPTIFVIDQKGVIRYKLLGDDGTAEKVANVMAKVK